MKFNINASPAMRTLIDAHHVSQRVWPWVKSPRGSIEAYRLTADEQTQRVGGHVIVGGETRKLSRSLRHELTKQYFYDQRPMLWAHNERLLAKRPALSPVQPLAAPQTFRARISQLLSPAPRFRPRISQMDGVARTPPPSLYPNPRSLPRPVEPLTLPQMPDANAWGTATETLVSQAFRRVSEESHDSAAPILPLRIFLPGETWAEQTMQALQPAVQTVASGPVETRHVEARHRSYTAELFDVATVSAAPVKTAQRPPAPAKSMLRKPLTQSRRLALRLMNGQLPPIAVEPVA